MRFLSCACLVGRKKRFFCAQVSHFTSGVNQKLHDASGRLRLTFSRKIFKRFSQNSTFSLHEIFVWSLCNIKNHFCWLLRNLERGNLNFKIKSFILLQEFTNWIKCMDVEMLSIYIICDVYCFWHRTGWSLHAKFKSKILFKAEFNRLKILKADFGRSN